MSKFLDDGELKEAHAFIQYKNTDICIDFYCECGNQCHYDGYFAYVVECPYCHTDYEMPSLLIPRVSKRDGPKVIPEKEPEDD